MVAHYNIYYLVKVGCSFCLLMLVPGFLVVLSKVVQTGENIHGVQTQFQHRVAIAAFPLLFHLCTVFILYRFMWLQHLQFEKWLNSTLTNCCLHKWSQASVVIWVCLSDSHQLCFASVLPKYWTCQNCEKMRSYLGKPIFFSCHSCWRLYKELLCLGSDICEKCAFTLHVTLLIIQYCIHSFPLGFQAKMFGWLLH